MVLKVEPCSGLAAIQSPASHPSAAFSNIQKHEKTSDWSTNGKLAAIEARRR
jgi:hypothetical protein